MLISIVCHGNIARSQILHHCFYKSLKEKGMEAEIYSCGTAEKNSYEGVDALLVAAKFR